MIKVGNDVNVFTIGLVDEHIQYLFNTDEHIQRTTKSSVNALLEFVHLVVECNTVHDVSVVFLQIFKLLL